MSAPIRAAETMRQMTAGLTSDQPIRKHAFLDQVTTERGGNRRDVAIRAFSLLVAEGWLDVRWSREGQALVYPGPRHPRWMPENNSSAPAESA